MSDDKNKSIADMGRGDLEEHAARLEERCSTLTEQVQTLQARLHAKDREILEYERALERAKTQVGHLSVEGSEAKLGDFHQRLVKLEQTVEYLRSQSGAEVERGRQADEETPGG